MACAMDDAEVVAFLEALPARTAELRHWATVIGGRYTGEDRAEAFGARDGVPGELVVRLRPTSVLVDRGVAD